MEHFTLVTMHGTDMYLDRSELSKRADTPKCSASSGKMRGQTCWDRSEESDEDARADFENLVSVNDTILDRAFEIGHAPAESENRQAKTARGMCGVLRCVLLSRINPKP
jgi:hypothetical protein